MPFIDVTSNRPVTYGTASHGDEALIQPGGEYPSQLNWSDLHPPGVRVLPKGSPPAGAGEINWEDTLGGKFALALRKLEGLLYAVFGSRPGAYADGQGGWHKCQWYDRLHPRCLWGPETWKPRIIVGPPGCTEAGQCWDYQVYEYAALGDSPYGWPKPDVPIRSRSGDPKYQFEKGVHDRTYFPLGSVERGFDTAPFDPEGFGWFGATQPGRVDDAANPWLKTENGYVHKDGQAVTFRWTKPAGIANPSIVRLYWKRKRPGQAWTGWNQRYMTPTGDVYSTTFNAERHGTEFRWYVYVFRPGVIGGNPGYIKHDPGGDSPPSDDEAYYLQWFTHYNPYSNGLPEMLDNHGGVDVRHGTDHFQFDGSESVSPAMINLVRWTISAACGTTCTFNDTGCDEGFGHPGAFHHNPRFRGGGHPNCCIAWPIRFYWSGSNAHPHYRRRGKGDQAAWNPLDTRPLINRLNEPNHGLEAARKTWRGIENLFRDDPMNNPHYGQGASYSVPPFELKLWYEPAWNIDASIYAQFTHAGLRGGDVIDPVHIQEIIDAVDYLIDYGVWTTDTIKSCKKKPSSFLGRPCGLRYHRWQIGPEGHDPPPDCNFWCHDPLDHYFSESTIIYKCAGNCCGPTSYCPQPSFDYTYDDYFQVENPDCTHSTQHIAGDTNPDAHCDAFGEPSWEDCWNQNGPCTPGKCNMVANRMKICTSYPFSLHQCWTNEIWECVGCDGNPTGNNCSIPPLGCGFYHCGKSCVWWDAWDEQWYPCTGTNSQGWEPPVPCYSVSSVAASGLSYHFCTGPRCRPGWDDNHGGGFKKNRFDHEWCHGGDCSGLYIKATGPPGYEFSGNCFGDIFVCGDLESGTYPNVWFQERRSVYWEGLAANWYNAGLCNCSADGSGCPDIPYNSDPPGIPGFGLHDLDGNPLCTEDYHRMEGQSGRDGISCSCSASDFSVCQGNAAWVAVDLNLDGSGRAYRQYAGLTGTDPPHAGEGIPRLRDYDLTKDPATWMHDCPCETWTGAGMCA